MEQSLCPNCFFDSYLNGSCANCGYQAIHARVRSKQVLPVGTILKNRYYVGELLGEGGFGITYKVYDTKVKAVCAVKEYAPNKICKRNQNGKWIELASSRDEDPYLMGLRRFFDEARILSKLEQIPSVVDITDTFQENNTAYFAMEYLDGADLKQIVQESEKGLTAEEATNIILQVALSMDVIHTKTRIIHRDISPENIYITRNRKVKLIDFGSAKQTENGVESGLSVLVKLKFAPPEQFSTEMIQGSFTDVYSLAGTYYYALTGQCLPTAPDRQGGKKYVPLSQMNPSIDMCISNAVDHALMLNVNQRTQTMQQFIREITAGIDQKSKPKKRIISIELPYVSVISGEETGKRWVIPPDQVLKIGRMTGSVNIVIRSPQDISRVHCQISYLSSTKKFRIRDLSTYGVFYKGKKLEKETDYEVTPPARFALANPSCMIEVGVKYEYH